MFRVLIVCTANECRSVFASDFMRKNAGIDVLMVNSAGSVAFPGSPQCVHSITAASTEHSSKQLTKDAIDTADIVLTMERAHRARVAGLEPQSRDKTFTLPESAALASYVLHAISNKDSEFGDNRGRSFSELPLERKMKWFVSEMNVARGFVTPILDEILDTHGTNAIAHELAFSQIEKYANELVQALTKLSHELSTLEGTDT